jgi:hypothetical protein
MRKLLGLLAAGVLVLAGCGGHAHHAKPAPHASPAAYGGSVHPPGWGKPVAGPQGVLAPRGAALRATPLFTMQDTIDTATIVGNPFALAGYVNGHWPTYLPERRRWPRAHTISIAVSTGAHADCLDVEPGDATPAEAPGRVRAVQRDPGMPAVVRAHPCVYSSLWEYVHEVRPALANAGIPRSAVIEWDADYTGAPHLDFSFDGTQYTDTCFGRNLDCSLVTGAFLSVAQPPLSPPAPPDPYAIYPKTVFSLPGGQHASEHNTVATWDRARCRNPVRRPVCKSSRFHLQLLRDRAVFVAHHQLVNGKWVPAKTPRWDFAHLGARVQGIERRLTAR